jgi:hypothetical protein
VVTDTLSVHEQLFLAPLFAKSKIITCFYHLPNKTRESFMQSPRSPQSPRLTPNLVLQAAATTRCVTKDDEIAWPLFRLAIFRFSLFANPCCCTASHRSGKNDNVPSELANYMQVSTTVCVRENGPPKNMAIQEPQCCQYTRIKVA